jgi:hypothetical protein
MTHSELAKLKAGRHWVMSHTTPVSADLRREVDLIQHSCTHAVCLLSRYRIRLPAMVCTPAIRLGQPVGQQSAGKLGKGRAEVLPSDLERTYEERMVNVCRWYGDFALQCLPGRHPLPVQIA